MPDENIYGSVETLTDVRVINRRIRGEIKAVRSREALTELKKRSDYICTLTRAPSWQTKFGNKADRFLEVAREENERTTKTANSVARRRGIADHYSPWGGSDGR